MKKINIIYWIFTGLFCAFMLMSGITNLLVTPESVDIVVDQLGYPQYFVAFIGLAKVLGVIALLVPGFNRLKEWAYAGFIFDFIAATYSVIMAQGLDPMQLTMILPFGLFAGSYIYHHKRLKAKQ